ncbi:rCG44899 [Rattus norvegicus]|uniref:RCG44899 n=1 Tax=Rattus norvegicus TaxID=10116 RepID=A6KJV8_RAT|nr:rCG44899 [Rattus norvegicus]
MQDNVKNTLRPSALMKQPMTLSSAGQFS